MMCRPSPCKVALRLIAHFEWISACFQIVGESTVLKQYLIFDTKIKKGFMLPSFFIKSPPQLNYLVGVSGNFSPFIVWKKWNICSCTAFTTTALHRLFCRCRCNFIFDALLCFAFFLQGWSLHLATKELSNQKLKLNQKMWIGTNVLTW